MANSIPIVHAMCKYYIEDNKLKVAEGVLGEHSGRKIVMFNSNNVQNEAFPGYRNIERVWKSGDILWLTERDDAKAKSLFTKHYVDVIKDLQKQIDEVGDLISMIRGTKVAYDIAKKTSKCFGEVEKRGKNNGGMSCERQYKESWDCSEFVNCEQYAKRKVSMLKEEMFIDLSDEDENHILSLGSRGAIDAAVRGMINKYWPVC